MKSKAKSNPCQLCDIQKEWSTQILYYIPNNHNTLIMDKCVLVHFFHFQLIWWMIFQSFYNLKLGGKSKLSLNQDLNLVPLAYLNASALNTEILRPDILTVTHLITQRNFHSNLKQDQPLCVCRYFSVIYSPSCNDFSTTGRGRGADSFQSKGKRRKKSTNHITDYIY